MYTTPLRKARQKADKTLAELAAIAGLTEASVSRIERGLQSPTADTAEKLARYLGTVSEIEILYPERFTESKRTVEERT